MFPYLFLAPLAGYTTSSVRLFFRLHGADMVFTEMVSAKAILLGSKKTLSLAAFKEKERPIGVQIFGGDPILLSEAAQVIEENLKPDMIDINMGCPVRKVIKQGYGAALLENKETALRIAHDVSRAVKIPVSVKTRTGFDRPIGLGFFLELASTGISLLTIHGRTARSFFSGDVDWDFIHRLAERSPIPVIGNGGLKTPEHVREKLRIGNISGVMIGMGAVSDPFIFMKVRGKSIPDNPEVYFLKFIMEKGEGVNVVKRFALNMLKNRFNVRRYRGMIARSRDCEEILKLVKECVNV